MIYNGTTVKENHCRNNCRCYFNNQTTNNQHLARYEPC